MQAMLKTAEKRWRRKTCLFKGPFCHEMFVPHAVFLFDSSHTSTTMKHSEAAVLTVADLADLFTEDAEPLE